jgi:type VI secretion system secreted protein Hcp
MPTPFHVSIEGQKQGAFQAGDGISDIQGREGTILCQALDHSVRIPRDMQTGLPSGKRIHNPFKFTKYFDKASAFIYNALCSGEQLKVVEAKFYRQTPQGMEENYFTIKLMDAIIVDVRSWVAQCQDPNLEYLKHMEDVSCTYRKIEWTWVPDGLAAEDEWGRPK